MAGVVIYLHVHSDHRVIPDGHALRNADRDVVVDAHAIADQQARSGGYLEPDDPRVHGSDEHVIPDLDRTIPDDLRDRTFELEPGTDVRAAKAEHRFPADDLQEQRPEPTPQLPDPPQKSGKRPDDGQPNGEERAPHSTRV